MYYQDEEFHIREFRGGFNAEWYVDARNFSVVMLTPRSRKVVQGFGFPYKKPIGDINAVGWATDEEHVELRQVLALGHNDGLIYPPSFRLYLQNDENSVVEWCNSGQGWYKYVLSPLR